MVMRLSIELSGDALAGLEEIAERTGDLSPVMKPVSIEMAYEVKQNVIAPKTAEPRRKESTVKRDRYRDTRTYRRAGTVSAGRPASESRPILTITGGLRERVTFAYDKDYAAAVAKGPHSHLHELGTRDGVPERKFLFLSEELQKKIDDQVADFITEGPTE